jgi:YhcH/YjgK/YiaL family protein
MILDTLDHSSLYGGLHSSLPKAFDWLRSYDPSTPDGRYEIDGPGLVAIVQRYETAPAETKKWETHRVHGDIQYMVSGSERIGYALRETLKVRVPYLAEKDVEFYEPPVVTTSGLSLPAGSFAIFLPHDAHQPGVLDGDPSLIQKVVIKFRL